MIGSYVTIKRARKGEITIDGLENTAELLNYHFKDKDKKMVKQKGDERGRKKI